MGGGTLVSVLRELLGWIGGVRRREGGDAVVNIVVGGDDVDVLGIGGSESESRLSGAAQGATCML